MFLYWKKRGAYALEALPGALAELELGAVERFSWSSTLDIIEDFGGRCGSTFPGGLAGGPDSWSTRPPPSGRSLRPAHHAHATARHISSGGGTRPLLRAAAGGGEGPEHEDPGGLGGRQGRPSQAAWARQLGWEQGSRVWLWASGLVSDSVLCLQDQGQVVRRVFLECSCSRPQDMCPFSYYPHCR